VDVKKEGKDEEVDAMEVKYMRRGVKWEDFVARYDDYAMGL
jgi:hypothetical protein